MRPCIDSDLPYVGFELVMLALFQGEDDPAAHPLVHTQA